MCSCPTSKYQARQKVATLPICNSVSSFENKTVKNGDQYKRFPVGINVKERKKYTYENMQVSKDAPSLRKYRAKVYIFSIFFADSVNIQIYFELLHNRCKSIKKFHSNKKMFMKKNRNQKKILEHVTFWLLLWVKSLKNQTLSRFSGK